MVAPAARPLADGWAERFDHLGARATLLSCGMDRLELAARLAGASRTAGRLVLAESGLSLQRAVDGPWDEGRASLPRATTCSWDFWRWRGSPPAAPIGATEPAAADASPLAASVGGHTLAHHGHQPAPP